MFLDFNKIKLEQPNRKPIRINELEGLELQVYNNYHSKYNSKEPADPYHFETYYIENDMDLEIAIVDIVNQQLDFAKEGGNLDSYKIEVVQIEEYFEKDFE
mgnify:CR=1 FL=1